jgi:hypothetical protein
MGPKLRLITIRLGFVIIYLNQSSERNMIDISGCSERTNFKFWIVTRSFWSRFIWLTPDVMKTIVNEVKNFSKMAESSLISV